MTGHCWWLVLSAGDGHIGDRGGVTRTVRRGRILKILSASYMKFFPLCLRILFSSCTSSISVLQACAVFTLSNRPGSDDINVPEIASHTKDNEDKKFFKSTTT